VTRYPVLVALLLALAGSLALLREREHRRPGVLPELLAPEAAALALNAWLSLFQSLYGLSLTHI